MKSYPSKSVYIRIPTIDLNLLGLHRPDRPDLSFRPVRPIALGICQFWLSTLMLQPVPDFKLCNIRSMYAAFVTACLELYTDAAYFKFSTMCGRMSYSSLGIFSVKILIFAHMICHRDLLNVIVRFICSTF